MFVVEMLRWGDREAHSYVIGVFDNIELATLAAEAEKTWRGGKYEYEITEFVLNNIDEEVLNYHRACF